MIDGLALWGWGWDDTTCAFVCLGSRATLDSVSIAESNEEDHLATVNFALG